jgi:hypothetical protein
MEFHEVVITPFIASAIEKGGVGDPTTMLAYGAVEVEAERTMSAHGRRFGTGAYFKHDYLVDIPQSGWERSTLRKAWGPMDGASRQRRLSLRAVQTHCDNEGGERLVGSGARAEKEGEDIRR